MSSAVEFSQFDKTKLANFRSKNSIGETDKKMLSKSAKMVGLVM